MLATIGHWHITEMENWDADYFNMDGQAYVQVNNESGGEFQFGLVWGQIDIDTIGSGKRPKVHFTWEGSDEMDSISGRGWFQLTSANKMKGEIIIHQGDSSLFWAERAEGT